MDNTFYKAINRLFLILLLLNTLIISIIISLTVSSYNGQRNSLIEMGNVLLRVFESSRPVIFNPKTGKFSLEKIFADFIDRQTISNIVIYQTDSGNEIFSLHPESSIIKKNVENNLLEETEKDIILYKTLSESITRTHMSGRNHRTINGPKVTVAISINKLTLTNLKKFIGISLVVSLIIEILIGFLYFRIQKLIKLYNNSTIKLKNAEKDAVTGRLAHILAHEIKNPLSSISGLVNYLMKKDKDKDNIDILNRIQDEISRLSSIVNDFLSYGRDIDIRPELKSIKNTIEKTLKLLEHDIRGKNININLLGEDFKVMIDENKFLQIFVNLILNAIEGSPKNGLIDIKLNQNTKDIIIINNIVPNTDINESKIFEPFYTTKSKGSGLGLAIIKKLIELHNYNILLIKKDPFTIQIKFENNIKDNKKYE